MRWTYPGFALLLVACGTSIDPSLDRRACTAEGECLEGYVCSPERICVKRSESKEGDQVTADASVEMDAAMEPDDTSDVNTGTAPPVCDQGMTCGKSCVDIKQNTEHCGGCDHRCPGTDHGEPICSQGACAVACDDGYTRCGDRCYKLSSDANHCGSCMFSCPSESNSAVACVDGKCQTTCDPGFELCDGECVHLETNAHHCGACGKTCESEQQCAGGACVKGCPAGTQECERSCVDFNSDVQHCGGCGKACSGPAGAAPACRDGKCGFGCRPGLTACGDTCVDAATDLKNCGSCGTTCAATSLWNHAVCETGKCNTRCNTGFVACEGQCISIALLANNRSFAACAVLGGLNDISMCANMGEKIAYCSNQCVDTSQDERHCGGCGRDCAMGETCEGGMCKAH
ncbi:MAG TPA: hypothetical protein VJV78_04060 [Polyangiales bacterium]|nr:hypothetical protein [Polyangiales bacterium]